MDKNNSSLKEKKDAVLKSGHTHCPKCGEMLYLWTDGKACAVHTLDTMLEAKYGKKK